MDLLERLLQGALHGFELLAGLGVHRPLQQEIEADDLVGQSLAGLVVQLAGDPLPLALLRLQHPLRAHMALVLQPVEHGVEDGGDPPQVRVGEVGVDSQLLQSWLDGAHRGLQLAHRFEGEPQDQEVSHQDGDQSDCQQAEQEWQPGPTRKIDQRAADRAGGDDGAVRYHDLLKRGEVPVPPPRVQRRSHTSF